MIIINKKMTELLKSHPYIRPIKLSNLFNISNIYHANMLFNINRACLHIVSGCLLVEKYLSVNVIRVKQWAFVGHC